MSNGPIITISILEEAAYVGLSLIYGWHGFKLRDQLKKELKETARVFLERLKSFLVEFRIKLLSMPEDPDLLLEAVEAYRLLPNDAVIVAACQYYGIKKIATFDRDFNRVASLDVIR